MTNRYCEDKLKVLEDELNRYLAEEYGIDPSERICLPELALLSQAFPLVH